MSIIITIPSFNYYKKYPELGASPKGDHAIDRTNGWLSSREAIIGNKQEAIRSATP